MYTCCCRRPGRKVLGSCFSGLVGYVNHTYQRAGTLWEGRYKASLIDCERYLLSCYRYIELNPVPAGMVGLLSCYPSLNVKVGYAHRGRPAKKQL